MSLRTIYHAARSGDLLRPLLRRARYALALALVAGGGCDVGEGLGFGSPDPLPSDAETFSWFVGTWSGEGPEGPVTLTLCDYANAGGDDVYHREASLSGQIRLPDGRVAALSGPASAVHVEPPEPQDDIYSFRLETAPDGTPSFLRAEMDDMTTWSRYFVSATLTLSGSYALGWGERDVPPADAAVGPFEGQVEWRDIGFHRTSIEDACPLR